MSPQWPGLPAVALLAALLSAPHAFAANVCGKSDSPINPQALAPGVGGTGDTNDSTLRPGLGGTGDVAIKPGIGGTGIDQAGRHDNGGIGGTGIVGVITGFASICVNGMEVHYDSTTPINDNGLPAQASDLSVGQVVVVAAEGLADELQARQIALQHLAIGPLASVNPARGELEVLGQTVHWRGDAARLAGLQTGQWIRVSGLRLSDGSIEMSHLQAVPPQALAVLTGPAERGIHGGIQVGGATVSTEQLGLIDGLRVWSAANDGQEIQISGTWDGQKLDATTLQVQPTRNAIGRVERVVFEGYVRSASRDSVDIGQGRMALAQTLSGAERAALSGNREQRVRISGLRDSNDRVTVQHIEVQHSEAKRSSLDNGRKGGSTSSHGIADDSNNSPGSKSSGKTEMGDDSKGSNSGYLGTSGRSDGSKSPGASGSSGSTGSSGSSGTSGSSGSSANSGNSGTSGGSGSSTISGSSNGSNGRGKGK